MKVLKEQILQLSSKLNTKTQERLRERVIDLYKTYKEPELDKDGKLINKKIKKMVMSMEDDDP